MNCSENLHVAPPWCVKSAAFCVSDVLYPPSTEFEVQFRGWSVTGKCTSVDFLLDLCSICNVTRRLQEGASNEGACEYFADSWSICQSRAHYPSFGVHFREKTMKIVTWTILKFCRKSGAIVDLGPQMGPAQTDRPIEPKIGKEFHLSDSWDRLQGLVVFGILVFVFSQLKLIENVCFCCYRGVKFTFFCAH